MLRVAKDISTLQVFLEGKPILKSLAPAGYLLAFGITSFAAEFAAFEFSRDWQNEYADKKFGLTDPTILWAMANAGETRWSDIKSPVSDRYFAATRDHGLNFGIVVSTHIGKKKSFMSLARRDQEFSNIDIKIASKLISAWANALYATEKIEQRNLDVLRLLSTGSDITETAKALDITKDAVNKRLQSARHQMKAETTIEAVATAIRRNLI